MKYAVLSILSLIAPLASFADMPKPFPNPLAALKKGTVHFDCRMLGSDEGIGSHLMRFDLSLGKPIIDPSSKVVLAQYPVQFTNVQQGELSPIGFPPTGMKANYFPLDMDLSANNKSVGGRVLWENTPNEQIYGGGTSSTQFQNTHVPGMDGMWLDQSFDLSQDNSTKLVILRYTRTGVVDRGLPNCGSAAVGGCVPREMATRTEFVCDPSL
jgi:hypothetical protein